MRSLILFLSASAAAIAWILFASYGTPLHLALAVIATAGGCLFAVTYAERAGSRPIDQAEMHAALAREIFRARRYERPFTAVLVELVKADRTREIASDLRRLIRKTNKVGFWADRRLLLVLSESSPADGLALADRIKKELLLDVRAGVTGYQQDDSIPTIVERLEAALEPTK